MSLKINSAATNTDRTYPSLSAIEKGALPARIWLGIHFREWTTVTASATSPGNESGASSAEPTTLAIDVIG